jgi:hypothetical protein
VRQLEPDLHIDGDVESARGLAQFVPRLLLVTGGGGVAANTAANTTVVALLEDFVRE